jgi:hypothetical protein
MQFAGSTDQAVADARLVPGVAGIVVVQDALEVVGAALAAGQGHTHPHRSGVRLLLNPRLAVAAFNVVEAKSAPYLSSIFEHGFGGTTDIANVSGLM